MLLRQAVARWQHRRREDTLEAGSRCVCKVSCSRSQVSVSNRRPSRSAVCVCVHFFFVCTRNRLYKEAEGERRRRRGEKIRGEREERKKKKRAAEFFGTFGFLYRLSQLSTLSEPAAVSHDGPRVSNCALLTKRKVSIIVYCLCQHRRLYASASQIQLRIIYVVSKKRGFIFN